MAPAGSLLSSPRSPAPQPVWPYANQQVQAAQLLVPASSITSWDFLVISPALMEVQARNVFKSYRFPRSSNARLELSRC